MNTKNRQIIRELAKQVADVAALPIQAERRQLWTKHNSLQHGRPLILVFPEGSWSELLPVGSMQCDEPDAINIEWELRRRLYTHTHFMSDNLVEATWPVYKHVNYGDWGITPQHHAATAARGSWGFEPVINSRDDLQKLHYPEISYNAEATDQHYQQMQQLFGDILDVKLRGVTHISFHLMARYTELRGLEQVMIDMYDEPEMLHEVMSILEAGHRHILEQYIALNLLDVNNDDTYQSSGGNGFTNELPAPGYDPDHVRLCDMWASSEAQEMAQVSPALHKEFSLQYEKRLLEPFGLTGYGCCEDLTRKLDDVFTIPHIRRISISPWADVDVCAEKLADRYIFSWKPNPAHLVGGFDADYIRSYIKHTVDTARDGILEIILKDTHTCENHPERFDEWTKCAWELVNS